MPSRKGVVLIVEKKLTQRVPEELHQRMAEIAKKMGISINSLFNIAVDEYVRTHDTGSLEKRIEKLEKEVFKK